MPTIENSSLPSITGTTLANLVATPADGAAQTDYDFWVGIDGAGTGAPIPEVYASGNQSLVATSNNQRCTMKTAGASAPPLIRRMHLSDAEWTVALWFRTGTTNGSTTNDGGTQFFTNGLSQSNSRQRGLVLLPGYLNGQNGNRVGIQWKDDSSNATLGTVDTGYTPPSNQNCCTIWSYKAGELSHILANTETIYDFTYAGPFGTLEAENAPTLFSSLSGFTTVGSRLYRLEMYNRQLSTVEMEDLYDGWRERWGLAARA